MDFNFVITEIFSLVEPMWNPLDFYTTADLDSYIFFVKNKNNNVPGGMNVFIYDCIWNLVRARCMNSRDDELNIVANDLLVFDL